MCISKERIKEYIAVDSNYACAVFKHCACKIAGNISWLNVLLLTILLVFDYDITLCILGGVTVAY